MKNHTNCVIVVRTYLYEIEQDNFQEVRTKEFIFRNVGVTRRYCTHINSNLSRIYKMTEHPPDFFDKVVRASNGWALFNLYQAENIDTVPINNKFGIVSDNEKYQYLKELYVIFNSICSETDIRARLEGSFF